MKTNDFEYTCNFCEEPEENETPEHFFKKTMFHSIKSKELEKIYNKYCTGELEENNNITFTFKEFFDLLSKLDAIYTNIFANTDIFKVSI